MDAPLAPVQAAAENAPDDDSGLLRKVLLVAWGSILIAVSLELLLLLVPLVTGGSVKSFARLVADLVQKVSWSSLVCVGLALGTAVRRARPAAMGALGLASAPVAFTTAKSLHKGASQALGLATAASVASTLLIAALKALEYGVLGALLGTLSKRGKGLGLYLAFGFGVGLLFGSVIVRVITSAAAGPASTSTLLTLSINEMLFPVGCSLVIYAAETFSKKAKAG
ncbi:MAG TPA: hypothetical protein PK413_16655 [Thermoanaerobaculia bacterium]|nr:hypothetical protein [Thermoanaerobaculia bacterium]